MFAFIAISHVSLVYAADASPEKLPMPEEAALAAAAKSVSEIFKQDVAAAKTPPQKATLAAKMFEAGLTTRDDPAARFTLYRGARRMALGGGDLELAFRAVQQTTAEFAVDSLALEREAILEAAPLAKSPDDHYQILRYARRTLRAAVAADRFDLATPLADAALLAARKLADKDIRKQCEEEQARVVAAAAAFEKMKPALAALEQNPTDPAANAAAGKYYALVQGNWSKGLSMLALGSDEKLKEVATRDLKLPQDSAARLALADAWYDLAQTQEAALQANVLLRAASWYSLGQPGLKGLGRARVQTRLAEIDKVASPFRLGEWVELLDYVNLARDMQQGKAEWRCNSLSVPSSDLRTMVFLPAIVEGSYELRCRATRDGETEFLIVTFPFPGHQAQVAIGETGTAIWLLQGRGGGDPANPARGPRASSQPGVPFTVELHVDRRDDLVDVNAAFNGKKLLAWSGPLEHLNVGPSWPINPERRQIMLGFGPQKPSALIHSVQLKLTSGTARWVE